MCLTTVLFISEFTTTMPIVGSTFEQSNNTAVRKLREAPANPDGESLEKLSWLKETDAQLRRDGFYGNCEYYFKVY